MSEINYILNGAASFQAQFLKKQYELLERKLFSDAVDNLMDCAPRITDDCYNRALNTLLFHFCVALGTTGRPMSTKTYDKLMKLPMYRNLSDGTKFMEKTMNDWKERKRQTILKKQTKLNFDNNG